MSDKKPDTPKTLYLFLGFLILFVLSFSLGVIVGKGLGGHEKTQTVREEKSTEPPSEEVAELEKGPPVNTEEEPIAEKTPPPVKEEGAETEGVVEKPLASEAPAPITKKVEEIAEQTPAPTEAQEPEEKIKPEAAEIGEETPPPHPLAKEEPAKAESGKEEAAQKDIAALPATQPGGKYTVQIGAFKNEEKAKKFVAPLISRGYPVFIKQVDIHGQGTWYRARVGTFKTRQDAKTYGDNLKNREPDIVKLVFVTVNN